MLKLLFLLADVQGLVRGEDHTSFLIGRLALGFENTELFVKVVARMKVELGVDGTGRLQELELMSGVLRLFHLGLLQLSDDLLDLLDLVFLGHLLRQ